MWLVIGYGNELRQDDGVGPRVARAVAAWGRSDVTALAVPQLMPELADAMADAAAVLFVDASPVCGTSVTLTPVVPDASTATITHTGSPGNLLTLVAALTGRHPPAWLFAVPATDFGYGNTLSPTAERGVKEAITCVRGWIASEDADA